MTIVTVNAIGGPRQVDTAQVIWATRSMSGGPLTVLLRGGDSFQSPGDPATITGLLALHLEGEDQGLHYWINSDAVMSVEESRPAGRYLTIFMPDGHFIRVPNATEAAFRYALDAAKAQREGRPMPPPPAGVRTGPA